MLLYLFIVSVLRILCIYFNDDFRRIVPTHFLSIYTNQPCRMAKTKRDLITITIHYYNSMKSRFILMN